MDGDIAVVGVGLRFPGSASSPNELWDILEKGKSQWSEFPEDRLNIDGYYHPGGERQGTISFKGAHFLSEDISRFDAPFFSIPAADAKAIDPQQRLLLEVCYEAIENAGCTKDDLNGSNTSVYVGSFVKDYEQICLRDPDWQPQYAATGNGIAIMANRISYFFNLHGPSMTIDTGCSGSLVAVHLAAQSLRTGESSMAIAAGAGLILTPNTIMPMTALNFLSPDGKCFTFDSRANGYGRGEGIGVVILKSLEDAIKNNDTIRAVIRGSSVNQDGRTKGITLPSKEAQVSNIRSVYRNTGLCFDETAYVECHGTGTQAGDWRELKAISETLASCRKINNPLLVGSIKPNIGHLEGAAGVAGLIKGILMLEYGKIPPHINFETPNPEIAFQEWKVAVTQTLLEWPQNCRRRVSVNCFGFGGTNAHVIIDGTRDYFEQRAARHMDTTFSSRQLYLCAVAQPQIETGILKPSHETLHLFFYSSNERNGLQRLHDVHSSFLYSLDDQISDSFLSDYAYTLACRRSQLEWRSFFVSNSASFLAKSIESVLKDQDEVLIRRSAATQPPNICFLFCGQGSQWAEMGCALKSFPAFWNSVNSASWYLKSILRSDYDLLEEIEKNVSETLISSPVISQPAVTTLQVALVDLLGSFGVRPNVVVGHSSGEIAAAYASGFITREDAWGLSYYRGVASESVRLRAPNFRGGMLAVGLSKENLLAHTSLIDGMLEVACINSPESVTLSGNAELLEALAAQLTAKGIFNRVLDVTIPYHSSYMKLVQKDYTRSLYSISPQTSDANILMVSSVTGNFVDGSSLDAGYWSENMVATVQYAAAMKTVMNLPGKSLPSVFIEIGPSPVLKAFTQETLATSSTQCESKVLSTLNRRQSNAHSILQLVGELWRIGCKIDLNAVMSRHLSTRRPQCLTTLPAYAWNHDKSYWHESHLSVATRFRSFGRQDLIGAPTADSVIFEPRWRGFIRIAENPWIQDHQVQKTIIYPAAGMVCMVLEGARQLKTQFSNILGYEIREMSFEKALIIPNSPHGVEVALNMRIATGTAWEPQTEKLISFAIYSKQFNHEWERHSTGTVKLCAASINWNTLFSHFDHQFRLVKSSCNTPINPRQLYEHLDTAGISYGPLFRNITQVCKGRDRCTGQIYVPDTQSKMPANFEYPHLIHPATLDSMFQMLFAVQPIPKVPIRIERIFVSDDVSERKAGASFVGYAVAKKTGVNKVEARISMRGEKDQSSQVIINGLHLSGEMFSSSVSPSFIPNYRGLCTEVVWREDISTASPKTLKDLVFLMSHKTPGLSVLQRGGSISTLLSVLLSVSGNINQPPRLQRYSILGSDLSDLAKKTPFFADNSPFAEFIDIITDESKIHAKYNLIVDHDGTDQLAYALKCDGQLLHSCAQLESQAQAASREISLGYTETELRQEFLSRFSSDFGQDLVKASEAFFRLRLSPSNTRCSPKCVLLLLPQDADTELESFHEDFFSYVKSQSPVTKLCVAKINDFVVKAALPEDQIVISLLEFTSSSKRGKSIFSWEAPDFILFHKLQKLLKEAIWVTRGACMAPTNPLASPIIGLARTLMSEDPRKLLATFDLAAGSQLCDSNVVESIWTACLNLVQGTQNEEPPELDYAEEKGKLYIPRLEPIHLMNQLIEEDDSYSVAVRKTFQAVQNEYGHQIDLKLAPKSVPARDGQFTFCFLSCPSSTLGPTDVEIEFQQSVVHVSGSVHQSDSSAIDFGLGMDLIGRVTAVGTDVTRFQLGEEVSALVPDRGALQTTVRLDAGYVTQYKPGFIPSFFFSAYYSLLWIGKLQKGKTVLIHGGASGFSLAAVELGRRVGAETYITVSGESSEQQKHILAQHGVEENQIIDANNDSYISIVGLLTSEEGVDIVYNPTPRHHQSSLYCVKPCGTIVQFLKEMRGSYTVPQHNSPSTIVNLDLSRLLAGEKKLASDLLSRAACFYENSSFGWTLSPTLAVDFDISLLHEGVSHAQSNPQTGYVTISAVHHSKGRSSVQVFDDDATTPLKDRILQDGTYLLVGGLGGLGKSIAQLLVANGARHLAFISRSGGSSAEAQHFLKSLCCDRCVDARVYTVDACDMAALDKTVQTRISREMPRICGVFHCAAVLKDGVFENLSYDSWLTAFRPKATAAWNIVQVIQGLGHDPFFIFLASSAGVIGTRGQANYAAGNAFLDSLANSLRIQGKHAVSMDLGPILGAGMLADDEGILDILRASGFYGIRHQDFLKIVKHAVTMETFRGQPLPSQVVLGIGTGGLMAQNEPADPYWSRTALYSFLNIVDVPKPNVSAPSKKTAVTDIKSQLVHCTDAASATDIVCTGLSNMLAKSMNMLPDEIDVTRPANAYGVDSLVAVGIRNWVLGHCNVQVSVFEVMSDITIRDLAKSIVAKGWASGTNGC